MEKQDIKTIMRRYFQTPEISTRIKGYLKDRNLSYQDISNEQLVKMLQELSLLDTLLNKLQSTQPTIDVSPSKKSLMLKITKGRAFVDMMDLPKSTLFTISVCFQNRRYKTAPIPTSVEPFIGEAFEMKFDKTALSIDLNQMIELTVTLWHADGKRTIYAVKQIEWRFVLAFGSIGFDVELAEFRNKVGGQPRSVGILSMNLDLYPKGKGELISERLLNSQFALEKKQKQANVEGFYEYATGFWNEYKSIHHSFSKRNVKLYGETQDKLFIPMSKFICPLYNVRGIDSPFHALRFVSLIPFEQPELNAKPVYKRFHTLLSAGAGNIQDHCHLLCSLLLGFGLDAYVCNGYNQKGEHSWVMTQTPQGSWFWQTVNGMRLVAHSEKSLKAYKIITTVYNHESYYANIQLDDTFPASSLKLSDQTKWKSMPSKDISKLPMYNQQICLLHPTLSCYEIEQQFQDALFDFITVYRKEYGLPSKLDSKLSSILSLALANYQHERITESTFGQKDFQQAIKSYIPQKHTFKAFPIQLFDRQPEKVLNILKSNKVSNEILLTRGDSVFLAIKTKLVVYPDNFFVLWLSVAVRYYRLI